MKAIYRCPKCGKEKVITVHVWLVIILALTIIGGLIYSIVFNTKISKCKDCKVTLQPTGKQVPNNPTK